MKREKAARSGAGIRLGCTICASIRMLKSVMRPWCDRCGCARSETSLNGLGSEGLPWRRIRLTRNTKSAHRAVDFGLLQSGFLARSPPRHSGPQLIHDRVPCIRQGSPATTPAGSCDLTQRFPLISDSLARLRSTSCVIDGQAVSCDGNGIAAFDRIRYRRHDHTAFMYAFDLIVLLMRMPALTLARTDTSVVRVPKTPSVLIT